MLQKSIQYIRLIIFIDRINRTTTFLIFGTYLFVAPSETVNNDSAIAFIFLLKCFSMSSAIFIHLSIFGFLI